jgi:hypothetical protein
MEITDLLINVEQYRLEEMLETTYCLYENCLTEVFSKQNDYNNNLKNFQRKDLEKLANLMYNQNLDIQKYIHNYDEQLTSIKLNSMKNYQNYLNCQTKFRIIQLINSYQLLMIKTLNKKVKKMKK